MTQAQFLNNLEAPIGKVDVVLDTDAYNEIDDQFAIAYMLSATDAINVRGICAAPFLNSRAASPADGMEKSYSEILKLLKLANRQALCDCVYRGSEEYLMNENTPVQSSAAEFMAKLAEEYSPERPLYIVAIGAITNVASAILLNPKMKENTVVVWLGGNGLHWMDNREFNLMQDIAAARVLFGCGVPLVMLPCLGVIDRFRTTRYELEHWLSGKNVLCDYLVRQVVEEAESYASGIPWSRVIWDATAIAWLTGQGRPFFESELRCSPMPGYDHQWAIDEQSHLIRYIQSVNRDAVMWDLFTHLANIK